MHPKEVDAFLKAGIDPKILIEVMMENKPHKGYKGTTGRERCIRLDGTFDYIKMSELVHSGNW
jgi:hypothetical protein